MPQGRPDAGHVLAGRYRLVRLLARGALTEVWEARDEILDRLVAVKTASPGVGDGSTLERFRRETLAAARLVHPKIVTTYDAGVADGSAFVVMELVRATPLSRIVAERGALDPRPAVEIAAQVADALECAHREGVVHRHLKPANILVGDDGQVKVADFGVTIVGDQHDDEIAAHVADGADGAAFRAPEQKAGGPVDGRSDVYSLGAVLYELLCGRPPVPATAGRARAPAQSPAPPLTPRQLRGDIPRPLESVVLRAMSPAPHERYATAEEMHTALRSVALGDDEAAPVAVGDVAPSEATRPSFVRTERSWLVPVGLIVVAATVLGVVGALLAGSPAGQGLLRPSSGQADHRPLSVAAVRSFDPEGDGREHDEELPHLVDGDPSTSWSTQRYGSRRFGGLKEGVGVVVQLDQAGRLARLDVTSASEGWSAAVYVAADPATTLAGWGPPVATRTGIAGTTSLDLAGRRGRAVLLWITDLGDDASSASIGELHVTS